MMDICVLRRTVRPALAAVAAVVTLASFAAAQAREGSFDRTLKVSGAVDLSIRTGSGQIVVRPGASDTVRVIGRIRASDSWFRSRDVDQRIRRIEQNPPIEQQGNTIHIGRFDDERLQQDISISYDVTVPGATTLEARSGSGSQRIGDIAGPVEASTGSGSIEIGRIAGAVVASAGSGSLEVDGAGSLEARTGSGRIRAAAVSGRTSARSGSGSIWIAQTGKGDVEVSASSGGVTLTGVDGAVRVRCSSGSVSIEGRPSGPWSVDSSSGPVTLELPPDASFELDASTSSGRIDSVHPVTIVGKIDRRRLQGKVRGGGALVDVHASSGSIRIR
ncbi:MAG: DUF4097 family beta strand repeat-containing protein [Acidobacteriota bacterium]